MIFFWLREIGGWLLLVLGLVLVRVALQYVGDRQVVEAGIVAIISMTLMRTGILLVRISTAARIASRTTGTS